MNARGFSLIEIAIVLVIVAILAAIVIVPLSTQVEQQRVADTKKQLEVIKEAIIAYAIANGRFPCAARLVDNGFESVISATAGTCNAYVGFVPAVTLGISPIDDSGFSVDAWGLPANRIRYAVADFSAPGSPPLPASCSALGAHALTRMGGMKAATMSCLADTTTVALNMLTVCAAKPNGAAGAASGCSSVLTAKAPFVLISLGRNALAANVGIDEAHNLDLDSYFVSHTATNSASASGEFDDIVVWPSLSTIIGRLVQAGKLP